MSPQIKNNEKKKTKQNVWQGNGTPTTSTSSSLSFPSSSLSFPSSTTSSSPGRSSELPRAEEPYGLRERRSSSDSNKASSGEVSPYDNNSPVLSERRAEPGSPSSAGGGGRGRVFRVPGKVPAGDAWGAKGERGKNL